MRILSFYPTKTFKLILEFDNQEYRILDMKEFLKNDKGLMNEICNDLDLFMTIELDGVAGTVRWRNGVEIDPLVLYEASQNLDLAVRKKKGIIPRKITRLPDDYKSKISLENEKLLKLLRGY